MKHIFHEVKEWNDDLVYNAKGLWWIHIEDNFIEEIIAAKEMKTKSICCRELIVGEEALDTKRHAQSNDPLERKKQGCFRSHKRPSRNECVHNVTWSL